MYLTQDRLYYARVNAGKALDWIRIEDISSILVGANTHSPVVRAALMNEMHPAAKVQDAAPESPGKRRGFRVVRDVGGDDACQSFNFKQVGVVDLSQQQEVEVGSFFDIVMAPLGDHARRILNFRAPSKAECAAWVAAITDAKDALERERTQRSPAHVFVAKCRSLYESDRTQTCFLALIVLAFIVNILEAEIIPAAMLADDSPFAREWESRLNAVDVAITVLFSAEIVLQLLANASSAATIVALLRTGWFWLDLSVVGASWMYLMLTSGKAIFLFLIC